MGAWGSGNFENDDALDFVAALEGNPESALLGDIFDTASKTAAAGALIEATLAARVLAATEVVCALRGHPSDDFPDSLAFIHERFRKLAKDDALRDRAAGAVSAAIGFSELSELWYESDDKEQWNQQISGLIRRLSAKPKALSKKPAPATKMSTCICSICDSQIPLAELVCLTVKHALEGENGHEKNIFAHEDCLNGKLHPKYLCQFWKQGYA